MIIETLKNNVLISNVLAKVSLPWRTLARRIGSADLSTMAIATVTVTGVLLGVRQLGRLQPLELAVFDGMMRLRGDEGADPRILVVAVTESDIRTLGQWPLRDRVVAQGLANLQQHQPSAIGLDIFRDVPNQPGYGELTEQFRRPNVFGITYIGSSDAESIPPPKSLPPEQIGFNDLLTDADGIVRRNLMFDVKDNATLHSFSLRLALAYLKEREDILPQLTENNQYQLATTVFEKLGSNSGGYQNMDPNSYKILLNYRSGNIAKMVRFMDIINQNFDPEWVKDKIVIIGTTAPSLHDSFFTPYSASKKGARKMPGVLIHAQMVSEILSAVLDDRPLLWYWPEWAEILWIVAWATGGGFLAAKSQTILTLSLSASASLALLFSGGFLLFLQAGWIPLAAPSLAFTLVVVLGIAYQFQQARQQQQMVMKLLGQQTSPAVANALWNERDRLLESGIIPGQTVPVTVLFTDIKDFTSISEKTSSEVIMKWLNEYLQSMTRTVVERHGIVNKFIGDAVMALFGVPIARQNAEEIAQDARNAVNCALAMGECLQKLNQDWRDRGLPVIQIRAGIFTGPVTVGSLGGTERLEYGAIGDSVNIASRLESCHKERQVDDCRILIAGQTLAYLGEEFEVESWGPMTLKGKQESVEIFRVIRRKKN